MRITIQDNDVFYYADVSPQWAEKHDNGALISCGLTVGEDGFTPRMMNDLRRKGKLREITREQYNHSGCQSSCTLRGNLVCRW